MEIRYRGIESLSEHTLKAFASRHGIHVAKVICTHSFPLLELSPPPKELYLPSSKLLDTYRVIKVIWNYRIIVPQKFSCSQVTINGSTDDQVNARAIRLLEDRCKVAISPLGGLSDPALEEWKVDVCTNSEDAIRIVLKP